MKKEEVPHDWQAEDYHQNSHVQRDAALEVLGSVDLIRFKRALDIGCGDGKITAEIAKRLQMEGSILGIDLSKEMIDFAKKKYTSRYTNVDFIVENAIKIKYKNEFDLIFSSFAIQWIKNQRALFLQIHEALQENGCFVATIPLGISDSLERAIKIVISSDNWRKYFKNFVQTWQFYSADQIRKSICEKRFFVLKFEINIQKARFESRDKFEKYLIQWIPYLKSLPLELRDSFFHEIIENYLLLEPIQNDGSVRFCFPRVDIIANKINL